MLMILYTWCRFSAATDPRVAKEDALSQRMEAALLQPPGKPAPLEEQVGRGADECEKTSPKKKFNAWQ
jgi:hypothetical protein